MSLNQKLQNELRNHGASLVGFADLHQLPVEQRSNMPYGIVVAIALNPSIIHSIADGPTQEYFAEYNRVNDKLDQLLLHAGTLLQREGYDVVLQTTTEVVVKDEILCSTLPHKTVATRAGLGWIGKCALLITEEFGSAIRISSLLTNAPLETGTPIDESRCGQCTICKDACPASAPTGELWDVSKHRDTFFNAFECRKTAKARAALAGIDRTICGKCIEVCPWTRKYLRRNGF